MKVVRWAVLFAGAVAVIIGVAGLLVPVAVGERDDVGCGNGVFPDLTEARAATELGGANVPFPDTRGVDPEYPTEDPADEVIANPDYVELCEQQLADRRIWTISVTVAGGLAVIVALALGIRARQSRIAGGSSQ